MAIKATAGSVAAKQGFEYADNVLKLLNNYNTNKHNDKNLLQILKKILKEVGLDINDVKSITAKKPLNNNSKPDILLCIELFNSLNKEFGISIKKGSDSSISFNNQPLDTFLYHPTIDFNLLYPLGVIGFKKWLGLEPYKTLWFNEYSHEIRPQGCYLLEELQPEEREDMIRLCTNKDFLKLILTKTFICNNFTDNCNADIILYPRISNSLKVNDLIICNTKNLINALLNYHEHDRNIIQNIDPYALSKPGIRETDTIPNTIQFFKKLFSMQRKSSRGIFQTNLLMKVDLKNLEIFQKIIQESINQEIAGKKTFKNQLEFRENLHKSYPDKDFKNYLIRSSPDGYELAKVNFSDFWLLNKSKFDLSNNNEKDVYEGLQYILGGIGFSPIEAFQKNKLEQLNKKELLILKSIPFYYLKGSIKQEIKKFFDKNIRLFLELLIFNMHGNNFKGIIYNKDNYNNTKLLNIEILEKNTILDYAVDIYYKQTFTKKTKSLDLGICYFKRYGGGGKKATDKSKSALALSLKTKAFDNLLLNKSLRY